MYSLAHLLRFEHSWLVGRFWAHPHGTYSDPIVCPAPKYCAAAAVAVERSSVGPRERGVCAVGEALNSGRKLDGTFYARRPKCAASTPHQRQLGKNGSGERRLVRRFGTSGVETPEVQTRSRTFCAVLWEVLIPRDKSGIVRAGNVITFSFLVSVSRSVG